MQNLMTKVVSILSVHILLKTLGACLNDALSERK